MGFSSQFDRKRLMPDLRLLPAFILAVVVLMLIPGPNVALIVPTTGRSPINR